MGILGIKYLYKVYRVRGSSIGGSKVEYPRGAIGIESINILDSIIINIDKE